MRVKTLTAALLGGLLALVGLTPATAEEAETGSISGTVTLPEEWREGLRVTVVGSDSTDFVAFASVDPETGAYEVVGVPPGQWQVLAYVLGVNLAPEYYGGVYAAAQAPRVDASVDVDDVDIDLDYGRTLSGTVTLPEGAPDSWLEHVWVFALTDEVAQLVPYESGVDANGHYEIVGLAPLPYTVQVPVPEYVDGVATGLTTEYYDGATTEEDATPVDLASGDRDDIDIHLGEEPTPTPTPSPTPTVAPTPTPTPTPTSPSEPSPVDESSLTSGTKSGVGVPATAVAGSSITVTVAGHAGETVHVWLHSTPTLLGTVTLDGQGSAQVVVPAGVSASAHKVVVQDAAGELIGWADLQVSADAVAPAESFPVYRFWSDTFKGHFFTINETEKNNTIANYDDSVWLYEGVAYEAYTTQVEGTVPLYRFWSDTFKGHFFTINETEKNNTIANFDDSVWRYEGVAYYVYPNEFEDAGTPTQTVWRFWSDSGRHHFYTASEAEMTRTKTVYPEWMWRYEGSAFKVPTS